MWGEIKVFLRAYYDLIEACDGNEEWISKVEEDLGTQVAYLCVHLDEDNYQVLEDDSPEFA